MYEEIWKDYASVAPKIHDGERVLDFAALVDNGFELLAAKSLVAECESTRESAPEYLREQDAYAFDVVICFGTHAAGEDKAAAIFKEVRRILKPAGRLAIMAPQAKADAFVEAGGAFLIFDFSIDAKSIPGAKLLFFMRNPLVGRGVELKETCWKIPSDPGYNMNAFQRDYLNPWLVRGIVSGCGCGRLANVPAMEQIRNEILKSYPACSVDYGAALCGKIYAAAPEPETFERLKKLVEDYAAIPNPSPHQLRWQISCSFAIAALARKAGLREEAKDWFARAADGDVCAFSPTLGTKTMDALWNLADMCLEDNDVDGALAWLRKSFAKADEIVHHSWLNVVGDISRPVPIAYDEIALVCQKAARAAAMVNVLDRFPDRIELARAKAISNAERLANAQQKLKESNAKLKAAQEKIQSLKMKLAAKKTQKEAK